MQSTGIIWQVPERKKQQERFSLRNFVYASDVAVVCLVSYWIMTFILSGRTDDHSEFLGGMWAAVATIFVFRETHESSLSAGLSRLIATCVSFALCLVYLLIFPFSPAGMAVLIGLGTLLMELLGRRGDIVTTGITTAVVMVVAAMSPHDAWRQPLLRLFDTVIGIAVGITFKWLGLSMLYKPVTKPVR